MTETFTPDQTNLRREPTIDEVKAAVRVLMEAFDDGTLIRNTTQDHQREWAVKFLPIASALGKLKFWSGYDA